MSVLLLDLFVFPRIINTPNVQLCARAGTEMGEPQTHTSTVESIVDPAKLPHRLLNHHVHLCLLRHIHLQNQRLVLCIRRDFPALERCGFGSRFVHVHKDDTRGALSRVGQRAAFAKARTCLGWRS